MSLHPTKYNLDDPAEVKRLLRECEGYLHTCRRDHHGTDFHGREFAMQALRELSEGYVVALPPRSHPSVFAPKDSPDAK